MSNNVPTKKKFSELLKENLDKLMILVISLVYILQGFFTIKMNDGTVWDVLGSIGITLIVGFAISFCLRSLGLKDGKNNPKMSASREAYAAAKEKATPYFDKLSAWCDYKNAIDLDSAKKDIIRDVGLKWKAYVTGYYDNNKQKLTEEQLKALDSIQKIRVPKLKTNDLLADLPEFKPNFFHKSNDSKFGTDIKTYKKTSSFSDLVSRPIIGIICGLYGLEPLITSSNAYALISGMLWHILQIAMWISLGALKYNEAYNFIVDEYRQTHIVQKTEYLNEFIITMQNNPDIILKYDDDAEIETYIKSLRTESNEVIDK